MSQIHHSLTGYSWQASSEIFYLLFLKPAMLVHLFLIKTVKYYFLILTFFDW
ncbi:hypothetical protein NSP_39210 [Nodularia spumigena CCY9414]|nr:hypothetical protein NSP_39210 [Nodularia spumigena CCY9414]